MKRLYYAVFLIYISLIGFNCQKEISHGGFSNPGTVNNNPSPVIATIQGNIIDETGQPATGVAIQAGAKTATTDAKGYFRITNASLDKNSAVVTAQKSGYFKAFRSFNATSGANHVVIQLVKKISAGTVNATTGGSVTLSNGAKISLPANGIVNASGGNTYTGNVTIYATYIDPTADNIGQIVPGSFMADDKNDNRVTLASYGMLAVELESSTGEKLQIASGSKATLFAPIPSSLRSSAPNTIALWYVDEQTGIWKEEGFAVKDGNYYTGDVKHFSFWNCDISIPAVNVSLILKTGKDVPIVHGTVRITSSSKDFPSQAYGYTDSLGQVSGLVPANQPLVLEVLGPCNNPVYTKNLGSLSQNTDLGTITITNSTSPALLTIEGLLKNCTNQAVTDGYAIISCDNTTRYVSVNDKGEFSVSFLRCTGGQSSFDVIGVDETAQQQSASMNVSITAPTTNTGTILACGTSSTQYINYTLDGADHSITSISNDSLTSFTYTSQTTPPLSTWMSGLKVGSNQYISVGFIHDPATGIYPLYNISVQGFDSVTVQQPSNVVLTNYPASAGAFYEGTFSAKFTHINATPVHTISGSFRIRRQ